MTHMMFTLYTDALRQNVISYELKISKISTANLFIKISEYQYRISSKLISSEVSFFYYINLLHTRQDLISIVSNQ